MRRRVFAWREPVRAVCCNGAEWKRGSGCGAAGGGTVWRNGAVGWTAGAGQFECVDRDGSGSCVEPRAWDWLRGDGEYESLDARRNIWMAGSECGRDRDVLDEHDAECAAVGRG